MDATTQTLPEMRKDCHVSGMMTGSGVHFVHCSLVNRSLQGDSMLNLTISFEGRVYHLAFAGPVELVEWLDAAAGKTFTVESVDFDGISISEMLGGYAGLN